MWQSVILDFFTGVFGANGVPHFVRESPRNPILACSAIRRFPNLIAGWFSFTIAEPSSATSPISSLAPFQLAGAVDALGIALFHAAIGAFGRQPIRLAVTGHGGPP